MCDCASPKGPRRPRTVRIDALFALHDARSEKLLVRKGGVMLFRLVVFFVVIARTRYAVSRVVAL